VVALVVVLSGFFGLVVTARRSFVCSRQFSCELFLTLKGSVTSSVHYEKKIRSFCLISLKYNHIFLKSLSSFLIFTRYLYLVMGDFFRAITTRSGHGVRLHCSYLGYCRHFVSVRSRFYCLSSIYLFVSMAAKALIYGLPSYTDAWARVSRGHRGFELIPASGLSNLAPDLARYPKLKIAAIACWNDLVVSKVDGLHLAETLHPLVASVYDEILALAKTSSIKVTLL